MVIILPGILLISSPLLPTVHNVALLVLAAVSSAGHLSTALGIGAAQRWAALGLWQCSAVAWAALGSAGQRCPALLVLAALGSAGQRCQYSIGATREQIV